MVEGVVKDWLEDRGFGFITIPSGDDVFVHAKSLPRNARSLRKGDRVRFTPKTTARGVQAMDVTLIRDQEAASAEDWADVLTEDEYRRELTRGVPGAQSFFSAMVEIAKGHGWVVA